MKDIYRRDKTQKVEYVAAHRFLTARRLEVMKLELVLGPSPHSSPLPPFPFFSFLPSLFNPFSLLPFFPFSTLFPLFLSFPFIFLSISSLPPTFSISSPPLPFFAPLSFSLSSSSFRSYVSPFLPSSSLPFFLPCFLLHSFSISSFSSILSPSFSRSLFSCFLLPRVQILEDR